MRDWHMFTKQGNAAVQQIVDRALSMVETEGVERVWDWTVYQLETLGQLAGTEEADDTAVREAVYDAVVCG